MGRPSLENKSPSMRRSLSFCLMAVLVFDWPVDFLVPAADKELASGEAVIRGKAGASEIVITTTARLAGAIHSLTWNGREFIDSTDHGRQLQSAASFDCAGDFIPETFNPTEAG